MCGKMKKSVRQAISALLVCAMLLSIVPYQALAQGVAVLSTASQAQQDDVAAISTGRTLYWNVSGSGDGFVWATQPNTSNDATISVKGSDFPLYLAFYDTENEWADVAFSGADDFVVSDDTVKTYFNEGAPTKFALQPTQDGTFTVTYTDAATARTATLTVTVTESDSFVSQVKMQGQQTNLFTGAVYSFDMGSTMNDTWYIDRAEWDETVFFSVYQAEIGTPTVDINYDNLTLTSEASVELKRNVVSAAGAVGFSIYSVQNDIPIELSYLDEESGETFSFLMEYTGTAPEPTPVPTVAPTATPEPTPEPTAEPTPEPTAEPTAEPTVEPTATPEITNPTVWQVKAEDSSGYYDYLSLTSDGKDAWITVSATDLPLRVYLSNMSTWGALKTLTEENTVCGAGLDVLFDAGGYYVTVAPRVNGTHEIVYTDSETQETSTLYLTIADVEAYQPTVSINGIKDTVQYYSLSYECYDWSIDLTEYKPEVFLWANDTSVYENAVALTLENCTILENTAGAWLDEGEHDYSSDYYTGVYVMAAHAGSVTVQYIDPNDASVTGQVTLTFTGEIPAGEQNDTVEYWWNIYGTASSNISTETVGDVTSATIDTTQLPVRLSLYAGSYSVEFKRLSQFTYDADAVELFISEGDIWVVPKQNGETTISYLDVRTGRTVSFAFTFAEVETYVTSYRWNYTRFDLDGNYRNDSSTTNYFTIYPDNESLRVFLSLTQLSVAHPDIVLTEDNVTTMASMNLTVENGTYDGVDGIWIEADAAGYAYLIYTNPEDALDASMVQIYFGDRYGGYYIPAAYEWRIDGGDNGYSKTVANIGTEGYTILSGADFLLSVSLIDTDYNNYRFTDIDNFTFSEGLSYQFTEGGSIAITLWAQEDGVYTMSYTDDTLGETYTITLVLRNTDCFAPELGWYSTIQSYHTPTWWYDSSWDERTIERANFMPSMFITITDELDSMGGDTSFDFDNLTVVEGSIAVEIEEGEDPSVFYDRQGIWVTPLESGDLTLQYTEPDGYQRTTTMVIHFTGEPSGTLPDMLSYDWSVYTIGSSYVWVDETTTFNAFEAEIDAARAPITLSLTGSTFYPADFSVGDGTLVYDESQIEVVVNPDDGEELYLIPKVNGDITIAYTDDATETYTSLTLHVTGVEDYQPETPFWVVDRYDPKPGWYSSYAASVFVVDSGEQVRVKVFENSFGEPALDARDITILKGSVVVEYDAYEEYLSVTPIEDGYLFLRYTDPDDPTQTIDLIILFGEAPVASQLLGDVSGDETIDVDDGIILAQYLAGTRGLSAQAQAMADCDGDGAITERDLETLLGYSLPAPRA